MPISTIDTSSISGLGYGFKNRIINGAMGIWQRGTSFQPNSVIFGADRFASYKAGAAAGDYARSTDTPSGQGFTYSAYLNNADLRQSIELPGAGLPGDYVVGSTWTLSFWVKGPSSSTSTVNIGWANGVSAASLTYWGADQTYSFTTSWTQVTKTFTVTGTPTGSQPAILVYFSALGGASYITGVQLEKGNVATSFDYRPYGTELALCQRYYYKTQPVNANQPFGTGIFSSGTLMDAYVNFPVPMRITPTSLEQSGTATNYAVESASGGVRTAALCSSVPTFYRATTVMAAVTATSASSISASGSAGVLRCDSTNAYLAWSAEL